MCHVNQKNLEPSIFQTSLALTPYSCDPETLRNATRVHQQTSSLLPTPTVLCLRMSVSVLISISICCMHMYAYTSIYRYICLYLYTWSHPPDMSGRFWKHIFVFSIACRKESPPPGAGWCPSVLDIYIYIYMHVYVYVYACVCVYVYVYVCVYIYIYVYIVCR